MRTLWLGDPQARAAALAQPERWAFLEATERNDPGEPASMLTGPFSDAARSALEARLATAAHRWVAVEPVQLATTPTFDGDRLVPAPYALRAYVVAGPDGYRVLPGGLVRLAGEPTAAMLPNGFGSKDLWITSSVPELQQTSILRATMQEVHLRRTGRDLLSRTTDNLFWLGRYAERAEGIMRLLRSVLARFLEDGRPDSNPEVLQRLLRLFLRKGPAKPKIPEEPGWDGVEELVGILMHQQRSHGLRDSLDQLHRTATLVRDQISHDAWRMLNALHTDRRWRQPKRGGLAWPMLELLDDGIRSLNAFSGTEAENMTRNFAWRFLQIGRRIERARHLSELTRELILDTPSPESDGSLRLLLELGDSYMTYRSRYLMTPLTAPVLDLLLLDETNPRGVAFQLRELDSHFALLPSEGPHRSPGQRVILKLLTGVRLVEVSELCVADEEGRMTRLEALLAEITGGLPELSEVISRSYFAHAETPIADPGHAQAGRAVIYEVSHRTVYDYSVPVSISHHLLHLAPRDSAFQNCRDTAVEISPPPSVRAPGVDYFGNPTTFVTIQQSHLELVLHALSIIEVTQRDVPDAGRHAGLGGGARTRRAGSLRGGAAGAGVQLRLALRRLAARAAHLCPGLVHAGPAGPGGGT